MKKVSIPDIERIRPRAVLVIRTGDRTYYASLEDNEPAKLLTEKLNPLTVGFSFRPEEDGVFGVLPWTLPRCDREVTVRPGDLLLEGGDRIVIAFSKGKKTVTRLARIGSAPDALLKKEGAEATLFLEWSE